MFSKDVPTFQIDLCLPESERWAEVIAQMRSPARRLIEQAGKEFPRVPVFVQHLFARLYAGNGGLYRNEMAAWSKGLGISNGMATILNCSYELSHLHLPKLLGCTAGVRHVQGRGMVHVRTLDWPLPAMGDATCVFRFHKGKREFVVVGVAGQVGVLSGMRPGAFSATINWAPPGRNPTFDWGPTFLLRHVLETCDSYEQAVAVLRSTRLSTSVFFTVCGVTPDQGCVIERSQKEAVVRTLAGGIVVQGNHHLAERFKKNNAMVVQMENAAFLAESGVRIEVMARALAECSPAGNLCCALDLPPVLNNETVQKMEFCPATGEVKVWRRVGAELN